MYVKCSNDGQQKRWFRSVKKTLRNHPETGKRFGVVPNLRSLPGGRPGNTADPGLLPHRGSASGGICTGTPRLGGSIRCSPVRRNCSGNEFSNASPVRERSNLLLSALRRLVVLVDETPLLPDLKHLHEEKKIKQIDQHCSDPRKSG